MPESADISQALYRESQKADNYSDSWLSRAFYIAALRHKTTFTTAYKADKAALPFDSLPIALRLGALKPDWRLPAAKDVTADWKEMQVPGNWESRGLPDFDGVVWFTRTIDVPAAAATGATSLSLGAMRNTGEVWVNGQLITPAERRPRRGWRRPRRSATGVCAPGGHDQGRARIRSRRVSRTRATTAASSGRLSRCSSLSRAE